jgi:hypothetical protein
MLFQTNFENNKNIHAHTGGEVYILSNSVLEWNINKGKSVWNLHLGNVVTEGREEI